MPLFSIIIPVYNVQNYLSACVKSVVEQPGPRDWECILVDDGSTDQSGAMCDALAAELPGLQVIHRENGGLAAARNTGLKAATGDWLLFLDSDDAMAPGLLAQLRGALAAHPDCDWFIGKHLEWKPDGTLTEHTGLRLLPGPFDSDDYAARLKSLYRAGHWSVWKYCIRRAWLADTVRMLAERAVPVCGHLGLTPQSVNVFGGYKVQGRGDAAQTLFEDALALEAAGAQLLVLECVPVELAKRITDALTIPVIGIGAGNVTDGQILVMHDAFGITGGHIPKFAKNFLAEAGDIRAAVRQYIAEVESGVYPGEEHSFH